MNKIFPFLIAILCLTGFLSGQLVFDYLSSNANQSSRLKAQNAHYKSVFKQLKVETLTGEKLQLTQTKAPVVMLNFWASWCVPCLEEFPSLVELKKRFGDDELLILGINNDEKKQRELILQMREKYGLNFPIVADKGNQILNQFLISAIPVTIIFVDGEVYEVSRGARNFADDKLISKLKSIIEERKQARL